MAQDKTVKLNVESNVDEVTAEFKKTGDAIKGATGDVKQFNNAATDGVDAVVKGQDKVQKSLKKTRTESKKAADGFKQFKAGGDGIKAGFETAEGAMALFGAESEALGEKMKTLQTVMNLSGSVKGLKEGAATFKTFGKTAVTALQGIKKGVIATGVGALVVAVASIAAYWDEIVASMGGAAAEGQELLETSIEQAELQKTKYEDSVKYENILRAQGKSEKFIRDLQMEELNLAIEKAGVAVADAKRQKDLAIESTKFNQKVLQGILTLMLSPIELLIAAYNKIAQYVPGLSQMGSLAGSISSYFFDATETAKEADAEIEKAERNLKDLENKRAGIILKEKAERASRYKEKKKKEDEQQKELEDQQKEHEQRLKDQYNDYLAAIEEADEREYQRKLTDQGRDEDAVRNYYGNLKGQAEQHLANLKETDENYLEQKRLLEEQIANLDRQQKEELLEIENNYQDEATANALSKEKELQDLKYFLMAEGVEKEKLLLEDSYKEKFKLAEGNAEMTIALEEKLAQEKAAIDREANRAKVDMALRGFEAIGDIIGAFSAKNEEDAEKQFKIQKAFNLASAITNTALAVTGALTAGGNPIKLASGAQFVEAGIAAAVGAANIIKIAQSQFKGGSTGGDDGTSELSGAGTGAVTPSFNIVGDSGINDLEGLGEQPPIQAYVTSQDVTTAQGLDRARVENATI